MLAVAAKKADSGEQSEKQAKSTACSDQGAELEKSFSDLYSSVDSWKDKWLNEAKKDTGSRKFADPKVKNQKLNVSSHDGVMTTKSDSSRAPESGIFEIQAGAGDGGGSQQVTLECRYAQLMRSGDKHMDVGETSKAIELYEEAAVIENQLSILAGS